MCVHGRCASGGGVPRVGGRTGRARVNVALRTSRTFPWALATRAFPPLLLQVVKQSQPPIRVMVGSDATMLAKIYYNLGEAITDFLVSPHTGGFDAVFQAVQH
jgi:hypothetical protein